MAFIFFSFKRLWIEGTLSHSLYNSWPPNCDTICFAKTTVGLTLWGSDILLSDRLILDIPIQSANSIRTGNFTPGHRNIRNMKGPPPHKNCHYFFPYETKESKRLPYVGDDSIFTADFRLLFCSCTCVLHGINWDFARLQKVATCRCLSRELRSVLNAVLF